MTAPASRSTDPTTPATRFIQSLPDGPDSLWLGGAETARSGRRSTRAECSTAPAEHGTDRRPAKYEEPARARGPAPSVAESAGQWLISALMRFVTFGEPSPLDTSYPVPALYPGGVPVNRPFWPKVTSWKVGEPPP